MPANDVRNQNQPTSREKTNATSAITTWDQLKQLVKLANSTFFTVFQLPARVSLSLSEMTSARILAKLPGNSACYGLQDPSK